MKSLVFVIMSLFSVVACAAEEDSYEREEAAKASFIKSLKAGDCYRTERFDKAKFSFENSYLDIGEAFYVMATDAGGVLIAQPNPDCNLGFDNSAKCEYWFRTVEVKHPFLINQYDRKIACPTGINKQSMLLKLKKSKDAKAFTVK